MQALRCVFIFNTTRVKTSFVCIKKYTDFTLNFHLYCIFEPVYKRKENHKIQ